MGIVSLGGNHWETLEMPFPSSKDRSSFSVGIGGHILGFASYYTSSYGLNYNLQFGGEEWSTIRTRIRSIHVS